LAFDNISGIITTNLEKTAKFFKGAGRERRVHHSKSLPLLLTGERFFLPRSRVGIYRKTERDKRHNGLIKGFSGKFGDWRWFAAGAGNGRRPHFYRRGSGID
jgi:hypothetical protein